MNMFMLAVPGPWAGAMLHVSYGHAGEEFDMRDLTSEQLEQIRHPHPKKGLNSRDILAKFVGITEKSDPKNAINLDLYAHTLRVYNCKMTSSQGLFSIVKEIHSQSTQQRLQVDRSFQAFKELLLAHSVQRPPYSTGLFTLAEMKAIMAWMLDTYYRHYKLYMYAFTDRVLMSATQVHPLDTVEEAPQIPPLMDALTEEQYMEAVSEEQRKVEEEQRLQAEADAEAAEAERLARLREEYVAAVPDEIREQVAAAVAREVELLKKSMEEQFQAQQSSLQARLDDLQAKAGAAS